MGIWEFVAGFVVGAIIGAIAGFVYGGVAAAWSYAKHGSKIVEEQVKRRVSDQGEESKDRKKMKAEILRHAHQLTMLGEQITYEEIHHRWGDEGVIILHELAQEHAKND